MASGYNRSSNLRSAPQERIIYPNSEIWKRSNGSLWDCLFFSLLHLSHLVCIVSVARAKEDKDRGTELENKQEIILPEEVQCIKLSPIFNLVYGFFGTTNIKLLNCTSFTILISHEIQQEIQHLSDFWAFGGLLSYPIYIYRLMDGFSFLTYIYIWSFIDQWNVSL